MKKIFLTLFFFSLTTQAFAGYFRSSNGCNIETSIRDGQLEAMRILHHIDQEDKVVSFTTIAQDKNMVGHIVVSKSKYIKGRSRYFYDAILKNGRIFQLREWKSVRESRYSNQFRWVKQKTCLF